MIYPNFHGGLALPSNTSSLKAQDALQRPVHENNGLSSDLSNQLLPELDPRIPIVGQHTFGEYPTYKPNFILPDWRKNRNQQETTPLEREREIAMEERAAMEVESRAGGGQWTNGAHAQSTSYDLSIQGKPGGYHLRSSSFVGETGAQTIDKILRITYTPAQVPTNQQQLVPIAAQQPSEISKQRHAVKVLRIFSNFCYKFLIFILNFCNKIFQSFSIFQF